MDWVADLIAAAALLLAVLTFLTSRRDAGAAKRDANAAALDSQRSADGAQRAAAALEESASLAREQADRYEVPWVLTSAGGDMVRLTNTNRVEAAHRVTVVEVATGRTPHDAPTSVTIGPREAVDFFGIRPTFDQADSRIEVRWSRTVDGAQELTWRHSADL